MRIVELDRRRASKAYENKVLFARKCRFISEQAASLAPSGWSIDIKETDNQIRVDFLDFPTEPAYFITIDCENKDVLFSRLFRKLESLIYFGGAA